MTVIGKKRDASLPVLWKVGPFVVLRRDVYEKACKAASQHLKSIVGKPWAGIR